MGQHLTPHPSTPFSSHNTCSHRWTIDLHIFYNNGIKGGLPLVISMVQFGLAVAVTLLFTIIPSRRMFGDRVASKPQKYLASQTFMASYPTLSQNMHMMSLHLDSHLHVQVCGVVKHLGSGLLMNQV